MNKKNTKSNKEIYREFSRSESSLAVFHKDWWLDAICGADNWDVSIVQNDQKVLATLPYYKRKTLGLNLLRMPPLTQFLGPWISVNSSNINKQLTFEKKVITQLIHQLPRFSNFLQSCNYNFSNGLPFIWKGFNETVGYTYVLEDTSDLSIIWDSMKGSLRTDINKAKEKYNITITRDGNIHDFIKLYESVFLRQQTKPPVNSLMFENIFKACSKEEACTLLFAQDDMGQRHAAIFLVWDETTVYYLASGSDPKLRKSQALTYLLWEAIGISSNEHKKFNFEGSMVESIERHFRSFGAQQFTYPILSKSNNKLLEFGLFCRSLFKK